MVLSRSACISVASWGSEDRDFPSCTDGSAGLTSSHHRFLAIDRQSAAFKSLRTNFRDLRDIIVMPGVGHIPPEERPEEINAVVLTFLKDISFQ